MHNDAPIVSSIVNLARQLGMGVIAEGVETPQQAKHLKALDCPHAQGYLFSRPLTATEARAYWPAYPPPARRLPPTHAAPPARRSAGADAPPHHVAGSARAPRPPRIFTSLLVGQQTDALFRRLTRTQRLSAN